MIETDGLEEILFLGLKILNRTRDMITISQGGPHDGFVDDRLTIS